MTLPRACDWLPLGIRRARGMTLVEVLVGLGIVALLMGTLMYGSGFLSGSRQRAAATLVITGVRLGMARANMTGRPVRMVLDLDQDTVLLEEASSGAPMLREKQEGDDTSAGAEPATELERMAKEKAEQILEGTRKSRPSFASFSPGLNKDEPGKPRALGTGIQFRQVQTEHDTEPRTEGRAYLYFWPRGGTERASVQIYRGGDDSGLTVTVSALTGRARIEPGPVPLPEPRGEETYSEREEE